MNNYRLLYRYMLFIALISIFHSCQNDTSANTQQQQRAFLQEKNEVEQKLATFFSESSLIDLNNYKKQFVNLSNASSIINCYKEGLILRTKLVDEIRLKTAKDTTGVLPDLFWLKEIIPAYIPQLVAEGSAYYLFNDYKVWQAMAMKSADKLDDEFIALQLQLFPEDSIEYFYPAYFLQTWDYGGSSLLGRSIHRQLLDSMERNWGDSSVTDFREEINILKERLIQDIIEGTEDGYWEEKDAILNELAAINSQEYKVLNSADKIALKQRFEQFQQPEENNILVNVQSGQ